MNVKNSELYEWAIDHLLSSGVDQPNANAQALFEEVFGTDNSHTKSCDAEAESIRQDLFQSWVKRRAAREPLHYIIGHRTFWKLDFKVTPQVLIPRPETEVLISHFLHLKKHYAGQKPFHIMDMCTGSGIIAVVVAKEVSQSQVVAVDISQDSLEVAQENSRKHEVDHQIHYVKSNLFQVIQQKNLGPFDFILSNPPYIRVDRIDGLIPEIKNNEPRRTFDGGEDGLKFYRVIVREAVASLKTKGYLIMETGFGVHDPVCVLIRETEKFEDPVILPDFNNYPRVVSARKI